MEETAVRLKDFKAVCDFGVHSTSRPFSPSLRALLCAVGGCFGSLAGGFLRSQISGGKPEHPGGGTTQFPNSDILTHL